MEPLLEFLTLGAESDEAHWQDEYWEDLEEIALSLRRLTRRRKSELRVSERWAGTPEAWSVAKYQEAILYRVVAAAQGTIISWKCGQCALQLPGCTRPL
jgi:hypothetical protein